jgi:pilus assembly protein Flp/PilA
LSTFGPNSIENRELRVNRAIVAPGGHIGLHSHQGDRTILYTSSKECSPTTYDATRTTCSPNRGGHPFLYRRMTGLRFFQDLTNDKSGVTAIEYALIAALIAVAAIAAFTLVGTRLSTTFSTIGGQL